jgi:selenide,water dikinase
LCNLPKANDKNLIVGIETSDDAAVYKINDDLAMIQTLDFFTPVVDDPYTFGMVAAANSLSDVYAMGGEPKLALNIVCFPDCLDPSVLSEILRGGYDKVKESGAMLVGGHSVSDDEPKYGLSVTGFIHPKDVKTNNTAKPGDVLVLTKPLGLGIINTAIKGELASKQAYDKAVLVMKTLNKEGMEAFRGLEQVHGVTDVTGFGLLGHCLEMAEGSKTTIVIESEKVPFIEEARGYAEMGLVPAGAYDNRSYVGDKVNIADSVPKYLEDILFDPQTSGGLLISASRSTARIIMDKLENSVIPHAIIGRVEEFGGSNLKVE